jgi:hypothetical protein
MDDAQTLAREPLAAGTLRSAVERAMARELGRRQRIRTIERRPSEYSSSFAIEELDVCTAGGERLELMFKDLSWSSLLEDARRARPAFLYDPRREIRTYQQILARAALGTAKLYGAVVDRQEGRYFLFLERVRLPKLCHVGEFGVWRRVVRWAARMHARFAGRTSPFERITPLLNYDARHYQLWINRAQSFYHNASDRAAEPGRRAVDWLAARYDKIVRELSSLPRTLIHGEFYASNILADDRPTSGNGDGALRVCPVDWEMAAIGPGLIDLAAVVAGSWAEAKRLALALTYFHCLRDEGGAPELGEAEFLRLLDCCRLHLAVQYVGWATEWLPPADQRQDWLAEAIALAKKLEL